MRSLPAIRGCAPDEKFNRKGQNVGVDVTACAQAFAEHNDDYEWISHDVTLSLSGLTTITSLEQKGYSLMPL